MAINRSIIETRIETLKETLIETPMVIETGTIETMLITMSCYDFLCVFKKSSKLAHLLGKLAHLLGQLEIV